MPSKSKSPCKQSTAVERCELHGLQTVMQSSPMRVTAFSRAHGLLCSIQNLECLEILTSHLGLGCWVSRLNSFFWIKFYLSIKHIFKAWRGGSVGKVLAILPCIRTLSHANPEMLLSAWCWEAKMGGSQGGLWPAKLATLKVKRSQNYL